MKIFLINIMRSACIIFIFLFLITGIIYPYMITYITKYIFKYQSNGSLIYVNKQIVGSSIIGQYISNEKYFHGRPSSTIDKPYNGIGSHGSNLSINNPILLKQLFMRSKYVKKMNLQNNNIIIPLDLITSSSSGLDPHITLNAAFYQANRIAIIRNIPLSSLNYLIINNAEKSKFYSLHEPIINVLKLNIKLDILSMKLNQ
uniref:Potassium-transporting ATPase KdpC subunit n=1 Tax=Candidatus Aschnera chinzeii TaxID=1485666 RepID=A0AAT9G4I4_9ENTR|nr:MAG: potassium-transporting ATPase subunit KdpC [Candidatus Aschnera chinzeii]